MTTSRDEPWIFRTYSGHSTAEKSNALYRTNLAKGQTGLSIAFDLPTQTGYDSDHRLAKGEVGKVGVPVAHIGDMRALLEDIPLDRMNTSMTINATAAWLLALYVAVADEQGIPRAKLTGTIQNDIIKEYLSRGTHMLPPEPSLRLIKDTIAFSYREMPRWNPINVCSYHLQEAGATPIQEIAFALATADAVLGAVSESGEVPDSDFPKIVGRISFFVNAGLQLITEICKLRAFTELWDELCEHRYGVADPKLRRFRYGVQVNSLGLTEQQPENNVHRILIEALAVTISKKARARALQLPAWNEALGLPRPWDQQWSLRMQQILAFETDLLAHEDIFDGSHVIEAKVADIKAEVLAEFGQIEQMGGAVAAIDYMKEQLVRSNAQRLREIETGERPVVGVNRWPETEPSPLATGNSTFLTVDEAAESETVKSLSAWRRKRDDDAVKDALAELESAAREGRDTMEPSIACAKAGVTTGEWGKTLRDVFGEYRAPTGVVIGKDDAQTGDDQAAGKLRERVGEISARLGTPLKILVGKPGLDGHSNGAEQIAMRARECGVEAIYDGIRFTPEQIVEHAAREKIHLLGLSIHSGSHMSLVRDVLGQLQSRGLGNTPLVVGGIIPPADAVVLKGLGVAAVYTPKDFALDAIIADIVSLAERANASRSPAA